MSEDDRETAARELLPDTEELFSAPAMHLTPHRRIQHRDGESDCGGHPLFTPVKMRVVQVCS